MLLNTPVTYCCFAKNSRIMKYLIIGGVAGGASTAARLRRLDEHATIILLEKGAHISYANCGLPYYIGDVITDRNKLFVQTASSFKERFNIDTRVNSEVINIDPTTKTVTVKHLVTQEIYQETYDKLVLSPGAESIKPPLPGMQLSGIFTLRNVIDTDRIKAFAQKKQNGKAVVIGAGFIGLEMAENLHQIGMEVTIIEMSNQILAPVDYGIAAIAQQHIRTKGVKLLLQTAVEGFEENGDGLLVKIRNKQPIEADLVIFSIGVKPDTKLAEMAGLALGEGKGILVNEFLQTSNPSIYAVGDAITFKNPLTGKLMPTYLAGPANKQGRICANNLVMGNQFTYDGSINTAIVKLFDLTIAVTGLAVKHLKTLSIPHLVSTTHSGSHAGYYPDAQTMTIQIQFSPDNHQLLGAQIIGKEGVDKRIDLLSSIIQRKSTIHELTALEHAYAPPYSSAKDPVNMAGFVAENLVTGKLKVAYWDDAQLLNNNSILIDVRTTEEYSKEHIDGAINIPVDNLREKLAEIPTNKPIFIYCQVGLRGYLAQRILVQNDFQEVKNLSGGFLLWNQVNKEMAYLNN